MAFNYWYDDGKALDRLHNLGCTIQDQQDAPLFWKDCEGETQRLEVVITPAIGEDHQETVLVYGTFGAEQLLERIEEGYKRIGASGLLTY